MTETLQKCQNCLKEFPQQKIATHFGYCRRNIKRCAQCGEMYDINSKEQHEEQFHKKKACQFCKKQFGIAQLDKHKNVCTQRTKFCEYCQLNVPINQFSTHLKACQSRTKNCDKCLKPISNKDYLVHTVTCTGVVEQPNSYDQYLKNQRERQQARQQYARIQPKPVDKVGFDMRKKQVPSSVPSNNYGVGLNNNYGNPTIKSTVATTTQNTAQSRPQIVNSIGSNVQNISSNQRIPSNNQPSSGQTYNPREVIPNNQQQKQQITTKNYQFGMYSNKNQVKPQIKNQIRDPRYEQKVQYKQDSRSSNVPNYNQNYMPNQNYNYNKNGNQVRNDVRTEVRPDIRYDANSKNDARTGSRNKISNDNRTGTGNSNRVIQNKNDVRTDPRRNQAISQNYGINRPYQNIKKQTSPQYVQPNQYPYKNEPNKAPIQTPSQVPSTGYNKVKKQAIKKQQKILTYDPRDYGGYQDQIPAELLENNYNSNNRGQQEEQMFQRAILQSMSQNTKKVPASKKKIIPKQLDSVQLMQTSFYKDYDEQKQKAMYEQIQRNAKKNRR